MAKFLFQAKTLDGRVVKGDLEAANESEARVIIRAQKLIPLKLAAAGSIMGPKAKSTGFFASFADTVGPKDLQVFTRQFSVLVGAGVPIVQALQALQTGARSPGMGNAIGAVLAEVEKGKRLGEAIASRPKVFDRLYINLVRAGEEGGVLDTVLNRLAEYIETSVKLRGKITGAMWYPAIVILIAGIVISGIMIFVIPSFVDMFSQMGEDLPALTQFVINLSNAMVDYWYLILSCAVFIPVAIKMYYDTDDGRKVLDQLIIQTPVFGSLVQKGSIARSSRTLATLLGAGVRIMEALDIAAATSGNWVIERTFLSAKDAVARGKSLTEPLKREKLFPNMVIQMIAVGEQTGNLDTMLGKIADFYEEEVEQAADALTSLVEPLLMVFLGVVIAVIVIAMYLPIFNLASAVTG